MQWVLPKITIKLFAPDPENKGTGTGVLFVMKRSTIKHCF
jgi:hypothetical protein